MARGNYYAYEARPVVLVEGAELLQSDTWSDLYGGTAAALIASRILTADLLPPDGSVSITWRPHGAKDNGVSRTPGYIEVKRHVGGGFRAKLTVNEAAQAARRAARDVREAEVRGAWEANRGPFQAATTVVRHVAASKPSELRLIDCERVRHLENARREKLLASRHREAVQLLETLLTQARCGAQMLGRLIVVWDDGEDRYGQMLANVEQGEKDAMPLAAAACYHAAKLSGP